MVSTPAAGLLLLPVLVGAAERRPGAARTATKAIVVQSRPKVSKVVGMGVAELLMNGRTIKAQRIHLQQALAYMYGRLEVA
jgi:hypothetical protein